MKRDKCIGDPQHNVQLEVLSMIERMVLNGDTNVITLKYNFM